MKKIIVAICLLSSIGVSAFASTTECILNIAYKGQKPKTIPIELEQETANEELFKQISGSLFIEILAKKQSDEPSFYISVFESQAGVKVATSSDVLLLERDEYKARISCNQGF